MTLRRIRPTKESKVAQTLCDLLNDITLDLDQVGIYLAQSNLVTYNRAMVILEMAQYEREDKQKEVNVEDYLF
jgi:hypothetical protein